MIIDNIVVEEILSRILERNVDAYSAKYTVENIFYNARDYNKPDCPIDMNLVVLALIKCIQELDSKIKHLSSDKI